ncbi:MAG TPA: hypothetical protein VEU62_16310 [Bryobacterales bacterium]|nr:hypothetical protein [Bryobacterales bacterium]
MAGDALPAAQYNGNSMKPGDTIEVEIEGIGTLRKKVTSYADRP